MFKKTRTKIVALGVAGALVLGAAVYVTAALVTGDASAAPATNAIAAAQPAGTPDQAQLRAAVLEMLKDRMGLTGSQAEAFADQMIARMQQAFPNLDLQAMIDRCNRFFDGGTAGSVAPRRGMMNGGSGMMNWATPQATPQGTPQGRIGSMPCFR